MAVDAFSDLRSVAALAEANRPATGPTLLGISPPAFLKVLGLGSEPETCQRRARRSEDQHL